MNKGIKSGLISSAIILLTVALTFYIFPIANTGWFSFHVHAQGAGGPVELACPSGTTPISNSGTTFNQATQKYRQWLCADPSGNLYVTFLQMMPAGGNIDLGNAGFSGGLNFHGPGGVASLTFNSGLIDSSSFSTTGLIASGSISLSGTGACSSITGPTGGTWNGGGTCTGTTGATTLTITPGVTAPHFWNCVGADRTSVVAGVQSSLSSTSCTINLTSVTSNDIVVITAWAF